MVNDTSTGETFFLILVICMLIVGPLMCLFSICYYINNWLKFRFQVRRAQPEITLNEITGEMTGETVVNQEITGDTANPDTNLEENATGFYRV